MQNIKHCLGGSEKADVELCFIKVHNVAITSEWLQKDTRIKLMREIILKQLKELV